MEKHSKEETSASRRISKDLALVAGSGVVVTALSMATLSLNARGLGVSQFGVLALIQAYVTLISRVVAFETWQPVIRMGGGWLAGTSGTLAPIVASGVWLDVLASLGATVIGFGMVFLFDSVVPVGREYRDELLIYCVVLVFSLGGTPKGVFRLLGKFDLLVRFQLVQAVGLFILSFLFYMVEASFKVYVIGFASIYILYNLALFGWMLAVVIRTIDVEDRFSPVPSRSVFQKFFRMAIGTSLLSTLLNTRKSVEIFVVGYLCDPAAVGIYSAVTRMVSVVPRFSEPIRQVMFPEFSRLASAGASKHLVALVGRSTTVLFVLALVGSGLGWVLSQMIVTGFLGPEFISGANLFALLLAAALITGAGVHLNPFIQVMSGVRVLLTISVLSYALFLALSLPLARMLDVEGVGVAALASELFTYIALIFLSVKILREGIDVKIEPSRAIGGSDRDQKGRERAISPGGEVKP